MQSLVADGTAYIRNADGRAEIYDIIHDPTELHDLAGSTNPLDLDRFRTAIEFLRAANPPE
jgi:hypothetical protein